MIATLKKERRKDKAKIQELTEIIQEQNCLFFLNENCGVAPPGNRENILKKEETKLQRGTYIRPNQWLGNEKGLAKKKQQVRYRG
jgi:hypothetical protein